MYILSLYCYALCIAFSCADEEFGRVVTFLALRLLPALGTRVYMHHEQLRCENRTWSLYFPGFLCVAATRAHVGDT